MVCLAKHEMNSLKWGKLYIPNCYYLTWTTDPTGCLKKDQVCINCVMVVLQRRNWIVLKGGNFIYPIVTVSIILFCFLTYLSSTTKHSSNFFYNSSLNKMLELDEVKNLTTVWLTFIWSRSSLISVSDMHGWNS